MSAVLVPLKQASESPATALTVLESANYSNWLEQQPPLTQNWIKASGYQGKGIQLLPDSEGELTQALFVCDSLDDMFACGELANALPAGDYTIANDAAAEPGFVKNAGSITARPDRQTTHRPS